MTRKGRAAAGDDLAEEEAGVKASEGEEIAGVDPDTGEIVSVSVETLQKKFGLSKKKAEAAWGDIAVAGLFCGRDEYGDLHPPLAVGGLSGKQREALSSCCSPATSIENCI